jgi:hypothetical protein
LFTDACIDLLAQVTFEYWSSLTKTSKTRDQNIYKGQSIFKQILNIQAQDIDQASYNRLQVFYHDLCSSHRDAEISSLNVNVWIWLGFEFESLEKIFTSAATDKVCLEQVYSERLSTATNPIFEWSLCVRKWNGNRTTIPILDKFVRFPKLDNFKHKRKYISCTKRSNLVGHLKT